VRVLRLDPCRRVGRRRRQRVEVGQQPGQRWTEPRQVRDLGAQSIHGHRQRFDEAYAAMGRRRQQARVLGDDLEGERVSEGTMMTFGGGASEWEMRQGGRE